MNTKSSFMCMNYRNRLIAKVNTSEGIMIAKDKCTAKYIFRNHNIPTPKMIAVIRNRDGLLDKIKQLPVPFVLKPANGGAGKGILIVKGKNDDHFNTNNGQMNIHELYIYAGKILDGIFSGREEDQILVEEYVRLANLFTNFSPEGTPDIRIIYYKGHPIAAMSRIPNKESQGKANLSQGALGVAIDIKTGATTAVYNKKSKKRSELTGKLKIKLPQWSRIIEIGRKTQAAIKGLEYCGVDVVYNFDKRPLIMEINGRPGLEIQNVTRINLRAKVEEIDQLYGVEKKRSWIEWILPLPMSTPSMRYA